MKAMADGALRLGQRPQPPPGTQVPLVLASALHAAVGGSLSEAARTGQLLVPHPQLSPPRMNTGPQATGELLPPGGLGLWACTRLPASGPSHWLFPYPECCSLQTGTEASLLPTGLSHMSPLGGPPEPPCRADPTYCPWSWLGELSAGTEVVVGLPASEGHFSLGLLWPLLGPRA